MIVNQDTIQGLSKNLRGIYYNALETNKEAYFADLVAMKVASTGPVELYAWLGALPSVKEWIGDRKAEELAENAYEIVNKRYEATIKVHRDDIEDDKIGQVKSRITDLANKGIMFKTKLISAILKAGETTKGYDAVNMFSTVHPLDLQKPNGTKWANMFAYKLTQATFELAFATMLKLKDKNGDTLNITPTHLIVPPALRSTALSIIEMQTLANGASNPNYKAVTVIVLQELLDDTEWYLVDLSKELKPFILQTVKDFIFKGMDKDDSESVFMRNEFFYGIDGRMGAGPGFPQLIFKGQGDSDLT